MEQERPPYADLCLTPGELLAAVGGFWENVEAVREGRGEEITELHSS